MTLPLNASPALRSFGNADHARAAFAGMLTRQRQFARTPQIIAGNAEHACCKDLACLS
ncbi:MAG TPA: hypothetical protein VM512_10370 [Burkholderiaceae bacterium]|nr:hypothetical protein [Burkholderiaceae bacterium]